MTLDRRRFLAAGAAASLAPLLPRHAIAERALGSATLTTISDGFLTLPGDLYFAGLPEDELTRVLAANNMTREKVTPACNVALYRDGENTVLFDVGAGNAFMPSAGDLLANLDAVGLTPEDVTHVVFTHAHPDHLWGLLDDFDDPLFYDAVHMMGRREWDYWWNPETVNTIGADRTTFAVGAKRRMEVIEDMIELFDDGDEVLTGIAAVASFGHTPGHMAFELRSGSDSAMIVGDAIANHHIAFAHPEWLGGMDQDPETAVAARLRLMDRLSHEQMTLVGFHLPGNGIGRAEASGSGYVFTPDAG